MDTVSNEMQCVCVCVCVCGSVRAVCASLDASRMAGWRTQSVARVAGNQIPPFGASDFLCA
jgi:hypothetical protein